MKIKQISTYKTDDVPDHLFQEVLDLGKEIHIALEKVCEDKHPNLIISALNFVMAVITKECISDDLNEQRKAAIYQAQALIGNIAMLNKAPIEEFLKEEP